MKIIIIFWICLLALFVDARIHHHRHVKTVRLRHILQRVAAKDDEQASIDNVTSYNPYVAANITPDFLKTWATTLGKYSFAERIKEQNAQYVRNTKPGNVRDLKKQEFQQCTCQNVKLYTENRQLPYTFANSYLKLQKMRDLEKEVASDASAAVGFQFNTEFINNLTDELTINSKKCVGPYENDYQKNTFVLRGMANFFDNGNKRAEIEVGKVWQNLGFLSTTNNEATSQYYAGCKPENYRTNTYTAPTQFYIMKFYHTDALKISGKWIEKCSAYPEESEFLINKGNCFKITNISDIDLNAICGAANTKRVLIEFDVIDCTGQTITYDGI